MAVLGAPLDPVTIASLKGTLDYYLWRGLPVVRGWPRRPTMPRAPAVQASAEDFKLTSQALSSLPLELQNEARALTKGTAWTWKDIWTAALFGNLYAQTPDQLPEPEILMPPLIPGNYYGQPSQTPGTTTQSIATGTMRLVPFFCPALTDFDRLAVEVTTTTGTSVRLAVYGPLSGAPSLAPLLLDTGPLNVAATGVIQASIGLSLDPGWYLIGYQTGTTRTVRAITAAASAAVLGNPVFAATSPAAGLSIAQAYGPFPDPLGAGYAYSANANQPFLALRAM